MAKRKSKKSVARKVKRRTSARKRKARRTDVKDAHDRF
jgi:hypothetical protein